MTSTTIAPIDRPATRRPPPWSRRPPPWARRPPPLSRPAALRGLRAAVVVPLLLVLTFKVIGNPQMATYAAFGSFANLVLAAFTGSRRDRLFAHLGLGVAGTVLLSIGTSVHATTALAAAVTLVVTFIVLMAGVTSPKAAAGGLAAMLAYVLAAASPGTVAMIPDRIAGWWLACAAATVVVVAMTPRHTVDQLRLVASKAARALAAETAAAANGIVLAATGPSSASTEVVSAATGPSSAATGPTTAAATATSAADGPSLRTASLAAQGRLRAAFNASPYRPTGLATVDQALGSMVELLQWVTVLVGDAVADLEQLGDLGRTDAALLACSADVLDAIGRLLVGEDVLPDLDRLDALRLESVHRVRHIGGDESTFAAAIHTSFHARTIAVAVRSLATDALIAARRADPETIIMQRTHWRPGPPADPHRFGRTLRLARRPQLDGLATTVSTLGRHASLRSVWVRNSARGAVAVAAAVAVADLTNVQHGFWVVLGTLTVLRTTATETGGTAVRALLGAAIGFLVGAGIVVAVGTDTTALWVILPLAVFVAAYTPGVAPFTAGQAAFTAMLVILYNLLIPVGWKVGAIRVEDIAVGCGISLLVGAFFWPRGATAVVAEDLHDAFVSAADFLVEASGWALGLRAEPPSASRSALITGLRLDDALRAYLTEQGAKSVPKEDLWTLVGAAQRLRLTATSVAELPPPGTTTDDSIALLDRARALGDWYVVVANHITRGVPPELVALPPLTLSEAEATPEVADELRHRKACQAFVYEHLRHLHLHQDDVIGPADHLGRAARRPWWRSGEPPAALPSSAGQPAPT